MPDRFANGDTANDDPAAFAGPARPHARAATTTAATSPAIRQRLPYLKSLGVTAIWLNPMYDNNDRAERARDVRRAADHRLPRLRRRRLLRRGRAPRRPWPSSAQLVDDAHRAGIKIILDMVANHTGPYHPWVDRLADADVVSTARAERPPREHVADLDARRPVRDAGDARGDARRLVHRHPARPQPERSRGRALHHPEHALVGRHDRDRRHPPGHVAVRAARVLARLDDGDQARVSVSEGRGRSVRRRPVADRVLRGRPTRSATGSTRASTRSSTSRCYFPMRRAFAEGKQLREVAHDARPRPPVPRSDVARDVPRHCTTCRAS